MGNRKGRYRLIIDLGEDRPRYNKGMCPCWSGISARCNITHDQCGGYLPEQYRDIVAPISCPLEIIDTGLEIARSPEQEVTPIKFEGLLAQSKIIDV